MHNHLRFSDSQQLCDGRSRDELARAVHVQSMCFCHHGDQVCELPSSSSCAFRVAYHLKYCEHHRFISGEQQGQVEGEGFETSLKARTKSSESSHGSEKEARLNISHFIFLSALTFKKTSNNKAKFPAFLHLLLRLSQHRTT